MPKPDPFERPQVRAHGGKPPTAMQRALLVLAGIVAGEARVTEDTFLPGITRLISCRCRARSRRFSRKWRGSGKGLHLDKDAGDSLVVDIAYNATLRCMNPNLNDNGTTVFVQYPCK